jgi:hypothetical protein
MYCFEEARGKLSQLKRVFTSCIDTLSTPVETVVSISANTATCKVYFKRTVPHQIKTSSELTCSTQLLFHKVSVLTIANAATVPRLLQLTVRL